MVWAKMSAKKLQRAEPRNGGDSQKRNVRNARDNVVACDPRNPGACASHCAVLLMVAVMSDQAIAPRPGCRLVNSRSVALVHQRERAVHARQVCRRGGRDEAPVELLQAGDD
jgi:hypothetical protein